jgi:hypothetical protein
MNLGYPGQVSRGPFPPASTLRRDGRHRGQFLVVLRAARIPLLGPVGPLIGSASVTPRPGPPPLLRLSGPEAPMAQVFLPSDRGTGSALMAHLVKGPHRQTQ